MSRKEAKANLLIGGGKCVINDDPATHQTEALLLALGRGTHQLDCKYLIADGSGTALRDLDVLRGVTPFACSLALPSGKACPAAAYGTFMAIRAAMAHRFGSKNLTGLRIAVKGLGALGKRLCIYLAEVAPLLGEASHRRGLHCVPDCIANAGGVIDVALKGPDYSPATALLTCRATYQKFVQHLVRSGRLNGHAAQDRRQAG